MKNKTEYARYLLILSLMTIPLLAYPQWDFWSEPVPISDSLSDNANAIIKNVNYYNGPDFYIFWEKSTDTLFTDIYARSYYTLDEPVAVLSDGQHHFKNPQIIAKDFIGIYDTVFFLLYEANISGNYDIYIRRYTPSGFSDPVAITDGEDDDIHMRCNNWGNIVWESDGAIYYAFLEQDDGNDWYVTDPVMVAGTACHNPVINTCGEWGCWKEYLAWEKHVDTSSIIYYSFKDNDETLWSTPEILFDSGYNTNLRFNCALWGFTDLHILLWDTEISGQRSMRGMDFYEQDMITFQFQQQGDFNPALVPVDIIVDEFWDYSFLTFTFPGNNSQDVFVNNDPELSQQLEYYFNLSSSSQEDRQPNFFHGEQEFNYIDLILVWESYRNGRWQLWSSFRHVIIGGIEEPGKGKPSVKVSPNPFEDELSIKFILKEEKNISFSIFNSHGSEILRRSAGKKPQGQHTINLDLEKELPPGIYFLKLLMDNEPVSVRIVKI